jgi:hypothetical protein
LAAVAAWGAAGFVWHVAFRDVAVPIALAVTIGLVGLVELTVLGRQVSAVRAALSRPAHRSRPTGLPLRTRQPGTGLWMKEKEKIGRVHYAVSGANCTQRI